ncbi:helix-hairpin-helix domain-containing protein [Haloferax sp. S1W]|uniref:DUF7409 domain-containing protein n=1 Tax=Haloferax sp. S1W TaxID=3377110 RepID=UPI0037CA9FD6
MGRDHEDAAPDGDSSGSERDRGAQTGGRNSTSRAAETRGADTSGERDASTDEAIEKLLRPRRAADGDDRPETLEDLKFVGPATASALGDSEIGVESILDGAVCYRDLVDAGVNPGVAAKIRRWHSLSWSFSSGDDLDRRSAQVRGLGDEEREWVAASSGDWGVDGDDAETTDSDDSQTTAGDWNPTGAAQATNSPTRDEDWTPSGSAEQSSGPERTGDWTPTKTGDDETRESPSSGQQGDWTPRGTTEAASGASTDGSGDALAAEAAWRERSKPTPLTTLDDIDDDDAAMLAEAGVRSVRRLATADPEHVADALQIDPETVSAWKAQARESME